MGASYSREDYKADADSLTLAGKIPGATSSKGSGDRDSNAVFVEAEAPLTKNWGIAAAGRLDSYSRYGTGFSPRLSSSFKTNDWLFRGSIGKGFRAPTLREESVSSSTVYPSFVDNFRCVQARESGNSLDVSGLCKESTYMLEIVTPDQLKTEKVTTGSLGTIYAPNSIFNLGIDIWYIQIKDRIGIPDLSLLTMAEAHGEYGYKNHGISIERDAKGRLLKVVSPASNLAKQEVSGLDVDAEVKVGNPRTFQVMWNLGSSYQLSNKEAAFEGQGLQERIGDADHPQWRAANTLTFTSLTDHQVSITGRTTSSMRKVNPDLGRLPVYTEYDSQCRMGHLFNGYIAFGALNITNSKPPEDDSSSPSLNYDIYSYAGRTFYASVGQAF
jgi:iron complex outermembrane receptor protein